MVTILYQCPNTGFRVAPINLIVDHDCQTAVNEYHKRHNYNDEDQERPDIYYLVWVNLFEDAPKNPDGCYRHERRQKAEED
jgi:hypothetical protein